MLIGRPGLTDFGTYSVNLEPFYRFFQLFTNKLFPSNRFLNILNFCKNSPAQPINITSLNTSLDFEISGRTFKNYLFLL